MADPLLDLLNGATADAPVPNVPPPAAGQGDPLLSLVGSSPAPAPLQVAPPQPTPAPSNGALSDFGSALVHNVMKPLHGAAQFVENAVASGAGLLPDNPVSRAIIDTASKDNAAQQQWEQQYQQATPDNAASYAGATVGSVAPFVVGGVAKGIQSVGDLAASLVPKAAPSIVPRIASGAAQGATLALTSPVDNGAPYWAQKGRQTAVGAGVGAAVPVAGTALSGIKDAVAPITNPKSVVADALRNWGVPDSISAPEYVPGSVPTTAQAVANPDIVAAEKALSTNPQYKPLFDARSIANNDARLSALNGIAGTQQDLQAAVNARSAATAPLRDALVTNGNPVEVGPLLDKLQALAKSPLGLRPTVRKAADSVIADIRANATTVAPNSVTNTPGSVTIPPAYLDSIRQNVKDYLAQHAPNGIVGSQQQAAFEPVRAAIVDAVDGANPGYRNYLEKFAELSVPVNTMEAGQSILDDLGNRAANASGAPQLTLSGINSQTRRALERPYGISPQAEATLNGMQDDLQRASISNSVRSPGSDTAYNLQAPGWLGRALYGSNFQGGKVLPLVGGVAGGAVGLKTGGFYGAGTGAAAGAMAGKKLADFASKRVNDVLAQALLNPQMASDLVQQPTSSALAGALRDRLPLAGLAIGNTLAGRRNQQLADVLRATAQ
jgi:hypothetical protein